MNKANVKLTATKETKKIKHHPLGHLIHHCSPNSNIKKRPPPCDGSGPYSISSRSNELLKLDDCTTVEVVRSNVVNATNTLNFNLSAVYTEVNELVSNSLSTILRELLVVS